MSLRAANSLAHSKVKTLHALQSGLFIPFGWLVVLFSGSLIMRMVVRLCILVFGLTLSTTRVLANPVGNSCEEFPRWIPGWDEPSGLGYVQTLEMATVAGVVLCNRTPALATKFCVKVAGHMGFCKLEESLPSPTSSTPAEESQDTGERRASLFKGKLNNQSSTYQISWRTERGNVKLPCCLCGTLAKNRK
jgi:hypothetical protein